MFTWQNLNSRVSKASSSLWSLPCHLSPTLQRHLVQTYITAITTLYLYLHLRVCFPLDCTHFEGQSFFKKIVGLPWWRSGWESACQCRGHGSEPWLGKIPHAAEQLGPWATTTEPVRLEPVLRNKRGRDSERPAHCDEEWPPLAATRESPCTETKTQHSQKLIN